MDGLNRFDGNDVLVYNFEADGHGLADAYVNLQALHQDSDGMLWIGTRNGLSRLDPRTEQFTNFRSDPSDSCGLGHNYVTAILRSRSEVLWIGTAGGLQRIDRASECFIDVHHTPQAPDSEELPYINELFEDSRGTIWIATRDGLMQYDRALDTVAPFSFPGDDHLAHALATAQVYQLSEDSEGNIWIGTFGRGLFMIDPSRRMIKQFVNDRRISSSLPDDRILAVHASRRGEIWIGTFENGLACLDPLTERFTRYSARSGVPGDLASAQITSFLEDPEGELWVGTWRGVNRLAEPSPFRLFSADSTLAERLSHSEVSAVAQDRAGILWVGTTFGGLNRLDPASGKISTFRNDPRQAGSLSSDRVSSVLIDSQDIVWIATFAGINRFNPQTNSFSHFRHDPSEPQSLSSDLIYSIYEDRSGTLWIGTTADGLDSFDRRTQRFRHFQHQPDDPDGLSWNMVWPVFEDHVGTLWVGTIGGGLNRFDRETQRFTHFRHNPADPTSLSHDRVIALNEDVGGNLWVGTMGGGLNRFDRKTESFRRYGIQNGLPHHNAGCILSDESGRLWIGTSNGLARFDPDQENFRSYGIADGLPTASFHFNACTRARDGTLYFGSFKGLVAFHPDSLHDSKPPPVVVTGFDLFNQPAKFDTSIVFKRRIELLHDQNSISFKFAALTYEAPEAIRYAYQLEGVDEDWKYAGTYRYVSYPNLLPGQYIFRVRAANPAGVWSEPGVSINVVVAPPFWQTWWFKLLMAGAVMGVLGALHRYRVHNLIQLERTRRRIADDLHDGIGSKIGSIVLRLDLLNSKDQLDGSDRNQMADLLKKVRQLSVDLRDTVWIVHAENYRLSDLVERMRLVAREMVQDDCLSFPISPAIPDLALDMEVRRQLFLIYKESLHNAVRHARASEIKITVDYVDGVLTISISDNGTGFDEANVRLGRGFRSIHMRAQQIGAELDVNSSEKAGTTVRISTVLVPRSRRSMYKRGMMRVRHVLRPLH